MDVLASLDGGAGEDALTGGNGNDALQGGQGDDALDGGSGTDTATYSSAAAGVVAVLGVGGPQNTNGAGIDTLTSIENLTGSGFGDYLGGDGGANLLQGLGGDDVLEGGAGNDSLDGGSGTDNAFYSTASSGVTVNLSISGAQDTVGAGTDTLANIENLYGSNHADTFAGNGSNNSILGNGGADTITGAGGSDYMDGGSGTDTFVFTALSDSTAAASDLIAGFAAGDRIDLSAIDADSTTGADQAFHLDGTTGSAGDIGVSYDGGSNITTLSLYVDNDATPDAVIRLAGNHSGLTAADFVL